MHVVFGAAGALGAAIVQNLINKINLLARWCVMWVEPKFFRVQQKLLQQMPQNLIALNVYAGGPRLDAASRDSLAGYMTVIVSRIFASTVH